MECRSDYLCSRLRYYIGATTGIKRDFQSPDWDVKSFGRYWFKITGPQSPISEMFRFRVDLGALLGPATADGAGRTAGLDVSG